ncbi:MAG: quinone-interacting membrane-bound oxidoreductase complex subunit QmoC [Bacteroidales bacterium]
MSIIKPDIAFKRDLSRISGAQLNQCMQCGTCSAVCSLAPAERPFPRKEMIWSGWGMKEKLLGNMDIWLCHQCGDCSSYCPRDVKPASVIAAIRLKTYEHYTKPRFLFKMVSKPALLPVALGIPVVVMVIILSMAGTFKIPQGAVDYSAFFPHALLNSAFSAITLLFYGLAYRGMRSFWKEMKRNTPSTRGEGGRIPVFRVAWEILSHSNFSGCGTQKIRKWAHMLVFFGFGLLILVTLYAIWASITHNYPLPLSNPFKIAGNLASLMIYAGIGLLFLNRIVNRSVLGKSGYSDWLLLIAIGVLTLSGTLVELARFGNWAIAYHLYFFHLVVVWFVIMYLPFTKLGHVFYRTAALLYARSITSTARFPGNA